MKRGTSESRLPARPNNWVRKQSAYGGRFTVLNLKVPRGLSQQKGPYKGPLGVLC